MIRSALATLALVISASSLLAWSDMANADWAYAFAQTSNGGWSYGRIHNNTEKNQMAKVRAMRTCQEKANTCQIVGSGTKGCGALAIAINGNGWGSATGRSNNEEAFSVAMANCLESNPQGCKLVDTFCDTTHGFKPTKATNAQKAAYNEALRLERYYRNLEQQNRNQQTAKALGNAAQQFLRGFNNAYRPPTPTYAPQYPSGPRYTNPLRPGTNSTYVPPAPRPSGGGELSGQVIREGNLP
jgi:hypothetical protein